MLPVSNRNKRGLINGLGSVIKFISGNLDQNDFDNLQNQLNNLRKSRTDEIQHVNKLISFSNSIAQKFYKEINKINSNTKLIKDMFQKQNFKIDVLENYQYIVSCVSKFSKIVSDLEETISLSFSDITNVKIFSPKDLKNIIKHLQSVYSEKMVIFNDYYYLYRNLRLTKTQVAMSNSEVIVVLSVPIIEEQKYLLYNVIPVPSNENIILVPSEKYYLQGLISKWTKNQCIKITTNYICNTYDIHITKCNLTNIVGCDFAKITNKVQLFTTLNNEHLLFLIDIQRLFCKFV